MRRPVIVYEENSSFCIGRQGENLACQVQFRFLWEWAKEFPGGYPALAVQRNGDRAPYLVPLVDGYIWNVTAADTAVPEFGSASINYILGDTVVKSKSMSFYVDRTLMDSADPPAEYEGWIAETAGHAAAALASQEAAEEAAESAETDATAASSSASAAAASASSAAASASAAQAAAAAYPTVTAERVEGGVKVTTTDAGGTTEATVYDGDLQDAPADGKTYGRKDGEWTEVQGGGGTSDYEELNNLPKINGVQLIGSLEGDETIFYPITVTASTTVHGSVLTADKTFAQISEAIEAGFFPYMNYRKTSLSGFRKLFLSSNNASTIAFAAATSSGFVAITITSDDTVTLVCDSSIVTDLSGVIPSDSPAIPTASAVKSYTQSSLTAYRTAADQDTIDAQKQTKITANGILQGDGQGGVTAAEKVTSITSASTNEQIPGAKAVYDAIQQGGGGGGDSAMTLLATVDCSVTSGNIVITNLDNLTEFYFEFDLVKNTSTTQSGYFAVINNTEVAFNAVIIDKSDSGGYGWSSLKWNGIAWIPLRKTTTAISKTNTGNAALYTGHNLVHEGKATSLTLKAPLTAYQATEGTIRIYGR